MTRPIYENADTLAAERVAIDRFCRVYYRRAVKQEIEVRVDFALFRGDVQTAWAEAKERAYSFEELDDMGGYMLSAGKWDAAEAKSTESGLPFILIINDVYGRQGWAKFKAPFPAMRRAVGGRRDRADAMDVELCVFIPISLFHATPDHACATCGRSAGFGYGVSMRAGIAGVWYCLEHRPDAQ